MMLQWLHHMKDIIMVSRNLQSFQNIIIRLSDQPISSLPFLFSVREIMLRKTHINYIPLLDGPVIQHQNMWHSLLKDLFMNNILPLKNMTVSAQMMILGILYEMLVGKRLTKIQVSLDLVKLEKLQKMSTTSWSVHVVIRKGLWYLVVIYFV